jgi:hypothetical protein
VLLGATLKTPAAALGIGFTECPSLGDPSVSRLTEVLSELGIPWIVFADNDAKGKEAIAKLVAPDGTPLSFDSPSVVVSGIKQMEQMLIDAGYDAEIRAVAVEVGLLPEPTTRDQMLKFLSDGKPWAAEEVARRAMDAGRSVPKPIRQLGVLVRQVLGLSPEAPGEQAQGEAPGGAGK